MGESESRWMTYRALADELGISLRAAEARARRNVRMGRWRHRIDNEPPKAAQVLVTPADLEAMRGGTEGDTASHAVGGTVEGTARDTVPHGVLALVTELHQRAEAAEARTRELAGELAAQRERAGRAEGERDAFQETLRAAQATAEEASRRARIAEDWAAAAHQRAAEVTTVMARVAEGLEHLRQTQATAAGAITGAAAAAKAATLRAGEAEARAAEASQRAETAEARLDELQRSQVEALAPDTAELETAQARAAEAERQATEARRQADEAERRATVASERLDRFQRERINKAQEDAERQGREAAERELASRKAAGPLARVLRAFLARRERP